MTCAYFKSVPFVAFTLDVITRDSLMSSSESLANTIVCQLRSGSPIPPTTVIELLVTLSKR